MNMRKYISAILLLLALAGSMVLLRLTAMGTTNIEEIQSMDFNSDRESDDSGNEGNDPALEAILDEASISENEEIANQPASPAWYNGITQNLFRKNFQEAINQIYALDPNQVNINFQDNEGWTLLHWAALQGRSDIALLLLQRGINKNLVNNDNEAATDIADMLGNEQLAQMINNYN